MSGFENIYPSTLGLKFPIFAESKASLVLLLRNGCKIDENLLESLAFLILKQCQRLCISASLRLFVKTLS